MHPLMQQSKRLARRLAMSVGPIRRLKLERDALKKRVQALEQGLARDKAASDAQPASDAPTRVEDHGLGFLHASAADVLRWDKEWCRYLARVNGSRYFTSKTRYTRAELAQIERLRGMRRDALYRAKGPMSDLTIWYDGADLSGKKVAEIGCGPSQLGRDLAPLVDEYVGLDYSDLALSIARLVCASNCRFVSLRDLPSIAQLRSTRDTVLCRHFFIHQNLGNATWVLRLANYLLRDGGVVVADFYWPDRNYEAGVQKGSIRPATDELREFASTMFLFSDEQIRALVRETGFRVDAEWVADDLPRRYFRLVKAGG